MQDHRPQPKTKSTAKSVIYRRPFVETNQTARISLQILSMSKSNPETKTRPVRPKLPARRPDIPLNYPHRPRQPLNQPPIPRPNKHLSAAGEGASTVSSLSPQALFSPPCDFFWSRYKNRHLPSLSATFHGLTLLLFGALPTRIAA